MVDSSKKKNRKKNGSTPVAAVRHFHFLNGVLFLMYYAGSLYTYMYMYSAQYEERELVTISVFSHFLGH